MEILSYRKSTALAAAALSTLAMAGCTIDSYLTDASNVTCDGKRTKADLEGDGIATFVVHGKENGEVATVKVRRSQGAASVQSSGDVAGAPSQILDEDGFTKPLPITEGAELSTFGAGGAWVIDVREDSVVIQGTCEGM